MVSFDQRAKLFPASYLAIFVSPEIIHESRLPPVEDLTNEEEKWGGDGVAILRYTTEPLSELIDEPRTAITRRGFVN